MVLMQHLPGAKRGEDRHTLTAHPSELYLQGGPVSRYGDISV
jgi:hypothetical protein